MTVRSAVWLGEDCPNFTLLTIIQISNNLRVISNIAQWSQNIEFKDIEEESTPTAIKTL